MAGIGVFYDYFEEGLAPIWLFINFGRGGIDWDRSHLYLPIEAPFYRIQQEDISDESLSISITLEDLTINPEKPGYYGIHLAGVKQRILKNVQYKNLDISYIERFIIQLGTLEELFQYEIRNYYK